MIKMMLLLVRKPGMSFEEFRDYYENRHVPLASSYDQPLVRYQRNYISGRMAEVVGYDCISEVWYDLDGQWSDHRDRIVSPEMSEIIARDEANFLDRSAMRVFVVEETKSAPDTLPGNRTS